MSSSEQRPYRTVTGRVDEVKRRLNGRDGNPSWSIWIDGRRYDTEVNIADAYAVTTDDVGLDVEVQIDDRDRIRHYRTTTTHQPGGTA